jgi:hypothetical protein
MSNHCRQPFSSSFAGSASDSVFGCGVRSTSQAEGVQEGEL